MTSQLPDYSERKITGSFVAYKQAHPFDDYPAELDGVDFDATDLVLKLNLKNIQDIANHNADDALNIEDDGEALEALWDLANVESCLRESLTKKTAST